MSRRILATLSLSLAMGSLLSLFTPFMREFSSLHIEGEWLAVGSVAVGFLCFMGVAPTRAAVLSMLTVLSIGSLIEASVIALPSLLDIVPNPVAYINLAEQQVFLGCFLAGPFLVAGGVLGGVIRAMLPSPPAPLPSRERGE